jgi:hypothetical protein
MSEAVLAPLAAWQNFYVIIGSAAATLTGLLFVVITLVSGALGRVSSPLSGIRVFSTPNVMHFGAALLIAALLSAPWPALWPAGLLVGLAGLGGSDLRLHRALGGAPPSELSPGALRLAVVHPLATDRLQRPARRGDSAPHLCGTGSVRHR